MMQQIPASALQRLAGRWIVLMKMLVVFARQVSLAHKSRAHGGGHQARLLEAALLCAAHRLSEDLKTCTQPGETLSAEEAFALTFLQTAHTLLLALYLMVRQLGINLAIAAEWLTALSAHELFVLPIDALAPAREPPFLDSG